MDKQTPSKEVKAFAQKLRKELRPEKIILFGSRAKGEAWKRSDYDFVIVSTAFEGMHWLKRISRVVRLWDSLSDIDALPYTPKEFEEKCKTSSVVRSAVRHGHLITS
jgi:predicted nucleotidyltransferase